MYKGVCILTPAQAFQYETHGIVPQCTQHRHMARVKADELVSERIVFRDDRGDFSRLVVARWVGKGKRCVVFVRSREWKRLDSAGTTVMQLVPAGGVW